MSSDVTLLEIQKLQFSDRVKAEQDLLSFLKRHQDPEIAKIELTPKPESLNSINGFVTYSDSQKYFFKAHVEENEQVSEYYNANKLANAGYPVVTARQITHRPGQQIALYEIVSYPTLFDLIKQEEDSVLAGAPVSDRARMLIDAQVVLDQAVSKIYESTGQQISAEQHAAAPVHQLFSHRLEEDGRLGLFYRDKVLQLSNESMPFSRLANLKWTVNGVRYSETLNDIIERAKVKTAPQAGLAVVGHGDAHNGNIFVDLENEKLVMFDPAFAGLHSPLIDLTKPLFHNVFARWMYYPEQVAGEIDVRYKVSESTISIEHSFVPSEIRRLFLRSRIENVLKPTLSLLEDRGGLGSDWQSYLRSTLFCCPFLTVNLLAPFAHDGKLAERYTEPIKLLGLAMAVELGAIAHEGSSPLTDLIDSIFA